MSGQKYLVLKMDPVCLTLLLPLFTHKYRLKFDKFIYFRDIKSSYQEYIYKYIE